MLQELHRPWVYEPGSTQKLITVAAAIEEGEVKAGTVIPDVADLLELRPDACRSADDDFVRLLLRPSTRRQA